MIEGPLFLHVAGAMLLVGSLVTGACAFGAAWRADDTRILARVGAWSLAAAIPAWAAMRGGAAWVRSREGWPEQIEWIRIGSLVADVGAVLLVAAAVLGVLAARTGARSARRAAAVLATVLVGAYAVAIWAMTTKPS